MKAIFASLLFGLSTFTVVGQYNSENLTIPPKTIDSYTFEGLRIFPIFASPIFIEIFKDLGKYISLSRALEEKKVIISEAVPSNDGGSGRSQQGGESVNTLYIENVSDDTVLVFAGEVVKGGKQDRMLAQNMLLPPKSGQVDVSVFCVEQNRWHYKDGDKGSSEFTTNKNSGSNSMRKAAIVDKNQSEVWKEVDNVTEKNDVQTGSSTFTALKDSKEYQEKLTAYLNYFENSIPDTLSLVGFVACTGDTVIGCDMFATHDMLKNQMDQLLQAYITEAITNGKQPTVGREKVQAYLDAFLSDESTQAAEVNKNGTIFEFNGRKLVMAKF